MPSSYADIVLDGSPASCLLDSRLAGSHFYFRPTSLAHTSLQQIKGNRPSLVLPGPSNESERPSGQRALIGVPLQVAAPPEGAATVGRPFRRAVGGGRRARETLTERQTWRFFLFFPLCRERGAGSVRIRCSRSMFLCSVQR
jgi:hypothetical protein